MSKNDGGPAFPAPADDSWFYGATLRDWFAGMALMNPYTAHESDPDSVASWAYRLADAMLKARQTDE